MLEIQDLMVDYCSKQCVDGTWLDIIRPILFLFTWLILWRKFRRPWQEQVAWHFAGDDQSDVRGSQQEGLHSSSVIYKTMIYIYIYYTVYIYISVCVGVLCLCLDILELLGSDRSGTSVEWCSMPTEALICPLCNNQAGCSKPPHLANLTGLSRSQISEWPQTRQRSARASSGSCSEPAMR